VCCALSLSTNAAATSVRRSPDKRTVARPSTALADVQVSSVNCFHAGAAEDEAVHPPRFVPNDPRHNAAAIVAVVHLLPLTLLTLSARDGAQVVEHRKTSTNVGELFGHFSRTTLDLAHIKRTKCTSGMCTAAKASALDFHVHSTSVRVVQA
jgi:hypothetical protein